MTIKIKRVVHISLLLVALALLGGYPGRAAGADDPSLQIVFLLPRAGGGQTVTWADMDGDGDLDVAIGAYGSRNLVYRNDTVAGEPPTFSQVWIAPGARNTSALVWGDFDRDGDMDLAAGNSGQRDQILRNDGPAAAGGEWIFALAWESPSNNYEFKTTKSLAVGDYDGDGDVDLAVGNWRNNAGNRPNQIYRNDSPLGGALSFSEWTPAAWSGLSPLYSNAVAWGDMDGDGDLDLALANGTASTPEIHQVYRRDATPGGTPTFTLAWESTGDSRNSTAVAWGDYDGDGDLDLAYGNFNQPNQVFRNDGPSLAGSLPWTFTLGSWSPASRSTNSLVWGDMDTDGDLDLIVANAGAAQVRRNQVFYNDGSGTFSLGWEGTDISTTDVAVADMDADGDLDMVTVNDPAGTPGEVYLNAGGSRLVERSMNLLDGSHHSMAWGDYDRDGDLDLAVGESGYLRTYGNDGNGALALRSQFYISPLVANSVAWGDMDGDGDLDLAAGTCQNPPGAPQRNLVYRNDGSGALTAQEVSADDDCTTSVAWGDCDGDGDLDLAAGNNGSPNRLYRNDGTGTFALAWTAPVAQVTQSLAWGDYDGDGDLDLAVGNHDAPNRIYRNDGAAALTLAWQAANTMYTQEVAWVDYDGDDDLDLAIGNWGLPTVILRNDGAGAFVQGWSSMESRFVSSLGWSDPDGDGDQDMAAGTGGDEGVDLYFNDGAGSLTRTAVQSTGGTMGLTWTDHDGDGDPDFAIESSGAILANKRWGGQAMPNNAPQLTVAWPDESAGANFYARPGVLQDTVISIPYTLYDPEGEPVARIEGSYSLDGGGKWYPAIASTSTITTNVPSTGQVRVSGVYNPLQPIPDGASLTVALAVAGTGSVADLEMWLNISHPRDSDLRAVLVSPDGVQVTLFDGVGGAGANFLGTVLDQHAAASITSGTPPFTGVYSPQNSLSSLFGGSVGGTWELILTDRVANGQSGGLAGWGLRIKPEPVRRTFSWDTFASGFFGQSDNVVLRLQAYPAPDEAGAAGSYDYSGGAASPYQWSQAFAYSFPFRVRGTQVRVISDTLPIEGAVVYRIPAGQARGGYPLADASGRPYTTDALGYLRGRGTVALGDTLVALLPIAGTGSITYTDSFSLYYTNATPTPTGLQAHKVTAPGVQTLHVSAGKPLLLFNLDVSLQWDARNDSLFLAPFEFYLQRASELLYDWTDGQAALGRVKVYHNRENWNDAHLRVYASNSRRPSAVQGGIVTDVYSETYPISETLVITSTYVPGQVHMGAVWNRYGEPGNNLGEDWARTLAHELGHYAFYLNDNYLGFDANGQIIPVESCPGAMADPYRQDYPYDEFHPAAGWLPGCQRTLSHQLTGRSDWATVETYYPWLDGALDNHGPSGLPLLVTQLTYIEPAEPPLALADPTFYLSEDGARIQPGNGTRAFLYQDDWALDLGRPVLDHILARGARPGDQVCVYEPAVERLGCETVSEGDEQLEMDTRLGWQPDIAVTPVDSVTLEVEVSNVPADVTAMQARLYPLVGPAGDALSLEAAGGSYGSTFNLAEPAFEGYVRIWAVEDAPRREAITDYAVGGNPASLRGSRASLRGSRASLRGSRAPVLSADGQVILFVDETSLEADEFYTLQAVTTISPTLAWASVVGQAYRLSASEQAPDLTDASINFSYMAGDVPAGGEPWLRLYYWDQTLAPPAWRQLPSTLDTYYNSVSAPVQGEGLYALMASVEVPLYGPGWNLVSYPLYATQAVAEALESIRGYLTVVYGYEAGDPTDPWKVYDPAVPPWVNDLEYMEYNHGYWIHATETVTWYLPLGDGDGLKAIDHWSYPPATYYGLVLPGDGFAPAPGMPVTAWIGDHLCGQGAVTEIGGDIVYSLHVLADEGAAQGCGTPWSEVRFEVGGQAMAGRVLWDNERVRQFDLALTGQRHAYLPVILK